MNRDSVITIDLHGRNVHQSRVAIEAALRRSRGVYRIEVIHGSNMGCTLREFVRSEYASDPRVLRLIPVNDGCTALVLREL